MTINYTNEDKIDASIHAWYISTIDISFVTK
jgi:hypothetical protein